LKFIVHFMRMFIFYLGVTPPKPEEENRYALILCAILFSMLVGMILLTRFLLESVFATGGAR
jgi:hypothetical protein